MRWVVLLILCITACGINAAPSELLTNGGSVGTGAAAATGGTADTAGTTPTKKLVAKMITAGFAHTCALLGGGTIKCWGQNEYGQLGNGTTTGSSLPVTVSGISNAVSLSAGFDETCAVLTSGAVQCWGEDGNNSPESLGIRKVPVTIEGISNATAIAAGASHTCALLSDSTVQCWGEDGYGQLGNGTTSGGYLPVSVSAPVSGVSNATAIAAGYQFYTCALLSDSTVKCWGYNADGELGNGTTTSSSVPVPVSGISTATAIVADDLEATCALLSDGSVQCWGGGSSVPVTVSGVSAATAIAVRCTVLSSGTVQCWGGNSSAPITVSGITNAVIVVAGDTNTCALLSDGTVQCWNISNPVPFTVTEN